jgi:hypothetical protein
MKLDFGRNVFRQIFTLEFRTSFHSQKSNTMCIGQFCI